MRNFVKALLYIIILLSLTGCENTKAPLPEVSVINYMNTYDAENETYGDIVIDDIIHELTSNDAIYGDITDVVLYDREDKNSSSSDLYLEIQSETNIASYIQYYRVHMEYSLTGGRWLVKTYRPDPQKETQARVSALLSEEDIKNILSDFVSSYDFGDGERISFVDAYDIQILDNKQKKNDDHTIQYTYYVSFATDYEDTIYKIEGEIILNLYTPSIHDSSNSDEYIQSDQGYTVINYGEEHLNFIGSKWTK